MQVGLKGESMNLASPNGISMVEWMDSKLVVQKQQPLMWHKVWKIDIFQCHYIVSQPYQTFEAEIIGNTKKKKKKKKMVLCASAV